MSTAFVVTIPMEKLRQFQKKPNKTDMESKLTTTGLDNLQSDVFIIQPSEMPASLHLKIVSTSMEHSNLTCKIWDMLHKGLLTPSEECKTRWVGGRNYECYCEPSYLGTFAVGLVYIISGSSLSDLYNYGVSITVVNYVCSVVTIISLSLFLIFTRFVGIFRLDQFHIALCLLLSTAVSLFIPHVPEDQPVLCAFIAVLVNFLPLCAFTWKFVFGLNALLMVVAPHLNINDPISKRRFYLPVIFASYMTPALIVGLWFGLAQTFKTDSGLCIGPDILGYRWPLIAPITAVVLFNMIVLLTVGLVVLRNDLAIRHSRVTKPTHLLVLVQLMLTLGIPYMLIYLQIINAVMMLLILPIGIALTSVFMFLLVAVIDEENRHLLHIFLQNICLPKYSIGSGAAKTTVASLTTMENDVLVRHHFFPRSVNQSVRSRPSPVIDSHSDDMMIRSDTHSIHRDPTRFSPY